MSKDKLVYKAKLAEQAERYDEMVEFMRQVAETETTDLSVEERNLLSVAYKNAVGARRASVRVLASIQQKKGGNDARHDAILAEYKTKVEKELHALCYGAIALLDTHLIPHSAHDESRIYFHKMKGDYFRYLAETASPDEAKKVSDNAGEAYEAATALAENSLASTHPIRLGLALNRSVYFYEIAESHDKAVSVAKKAFDEAISNLDSVEEENYKDSTLIMQLLRDNLTLWTQQQVDEE